MKIEIEVPDPPEGCEWEPHNRTTCVVEAGYLNIRLPYRPKPTYTDHLKAAGWPVGGVWPFVYEWAAMDEYEGWWSYKDKPHARDETWDSGTANQQVDGFNPDILPPLPEQFGLTWKDSLIHRADFETQERRVDE